MRSATPMTPERVVVWPLVALVVLAPLPFGAVAPWAWGPLAIGVALVMAGYGVAAIALKSKPPVPARMIRLPLILYGLVGVWIVIQMVPFTPTAWHHPIWRETATALGRAVPGRISVAPYLEGSALARYLTYGGIFWLSLQCGRRRETARHVFYAIAVAGTLYAVYGLYAYLNGGMKILWFHKEWYVFSLTSTFVNRNSYATFAGIGLVVVTALFTRRMLRVRAQGEGRRERARLLIQSLAERDWLLLLLWVIIAAALLLTKSRAGLVSTLIGLAAFAAIIGLSPSVSTRAGRIAAISIVTIGLGFLAVSGDAVTKRLLQTSVADESVRRSLYGMTMEAIGDSPLLGFGYGSFGRVFHLYRGASKPFRIRSEKAHDTYLENAMELGLPAAGALFVAVGALMVLCVAGVRRRHRDVIYPAAGVAVTILVGVHSTIDFSLQIPAITATYSLLMGTACAQCWSSRQTLSNGPRRRRIVAAARPQAPAGDQSVE